MVVEDQAQAVEGAKAVEATEAKAAGAKAGGRGSKGGKGTGSRRVRNRRRGGGDADLSLDETNPENQLSVSESSTASESSDQSDTPRQTPEGNELMSKTLFIQNKRFYVDVRETTSGKYVKLAEVLPGGKKSRLSLTMRVTRELRNHLTKFSEFYASLGPAPSTVDGGYSSASSKAGSPKAAGSAEAASTDGSPKSASSASGASPKSASGASPRPASATDASPKSSASPKSGATPKAASSSDASPKSTSGASSGSPSAGSEKSAHSGAAARSDADAASQSSPKSDGTASSGANVVRTPPLKSAVIYVGSGKTNGKRRYYIDLKENKRGRFLQISEAAPKDGYTQRYRIAIPAQGLVEVRDTLSSILREFGPASVDESTGVSATGRDSKAKGIKVQDVKNDGGKDDALLPIGKSMRVHPGKVIYFDPGTNPRGNFVKISQVTTNFRTSILLPTEALTQVGQILKDLQRGFNKGNQANKSKKGRPNKPRRRRPSKPSDDARSPKTDAAAA